MLQDDVQVWLDQAALAEAAGDWNRAIELLEAVIDRAPETRSAYWRAGVLCRKADRDHEAEMILVEGMYRFPSDLDILAEYTAIAEARQDWKQVTRRARLLCERFPSHGPAHLRLAAALKKTKRTQDAERVLLHGREQAPDHLNLLIECAEFAAEREDWNEAARRFEMTRDRFPDNWWSYKRAADMLKQAGRFGDAETVLLDGQRRLPDEPALFAEHAELADTMHDPTAALRRFELLKDRFPNFWWSWKRIVDILKATGRTAEAEALLVDGQQRFPREIALFFEYAELAAQRKDWPETLRRFQTVRDRFPDEWWSYRRIAEICRYLERFDDAESILLEGQQRFPDEPAMFFDHADIAHRASRYQDAFERYRALHERFPQNYWGYVRLAGALRVLARPEEAESMLIEAIRIFPDEPTSVVELCFVTSHITATSRRISLAELGQMVADRIARHGETLELLGARAHLAQLNGDYVDYMRQLTQIAGSYPAAHGIGEKIVAAREILLGCDTEPNGVGPMAEAPRLASEAPATQAELFACFESLGGGGADGSTIYGCEFGFAQRRLDIEPLSLLRWTGVTLANLTRLFACDFEGIGDVETTVLENVATQHDWRLVDTRYDLRCDHTHLDRLGVSKEQAQKMMCQRMSFLARKLREDLEDGEKIFVYRYAGEVEDEIEMLALASAVNSFGRNMLFFVCRADERHAPFTVRLMHPGLLVGYLDWFAYDRFGPPTDGFPANMIGWTRVCETAYRLWRRARDAG